MEAARAELAVGWGLIPGIGADGVVGDRTAAKVLGMTGLPAFLNSCDASWGIGMRW